MKNVYWFLLMFLVLVSTSFAQKKIEISPDSIRSNPIMILPEIYLTYNLDNELPRLSSSSVSRKHSAETPEIQQLRRKAQGMVEKMQSFIAIYDETSGGSKLKTTKSQYEIRMVDKLQIFKNLEGKEKETPRNECHKIQPGLTPGSQWSELPAMIGQQFNLRIQRFEDLYLAGYEKFKVFRYEVAAEDNIVNFTVCTNHIFLQTWKTYTVAVRGEVWTDHDLNIVRITMEMRMPKEARWQKMRVSMLYGWLKLFNGENLLVPTKMLMQGELDGETYWNRSSFTKYRQFTTDVIITP